MLNLYVDDDYINVLGKGTDEKYTGGIRWDYYYLKHKPSQFFLDKWMPKTGVKAVNTYRWGLMQITYTPTDISKINPDVNDYPYSAALFAIHSVYSCNSIKRISFQTDIIAGVMGPPAFGKEIQIFLHRLINYQQPKGWDKQLPADILLNVNITAEKMLWQPVNWLELTAGSRINIGTMTDGAAVYALIRTGKMDNYFGGILQRYSSVKNGLKRLQLYFTFKPSFEYVGYYALVDGGAFSGKSAYYKTAEQSRKPYDSFKGFSGSMDAGLNIVFGKAALSLSQKY